MIDLKNLINLLPSYFKSNDTYKDDDGKGILERFINICGSYFGDIHNNISGIMNILDFDEDNNYLYINLVWEFLGSIPYGYGALISGDNNNYWEPNLNSVPRAKSNRILKYVVSLYKIRGTKKFYEILLRFYDIKCTVTDNSDINVPKVNKVSRYFNGNDNSGLLGSEGNRFKEIRYDQGSVEPVSYDSGSMYDSTDNTFDELEDCLGCSEVNMKLEVKAPLDESSKGRILLLLNRFRPVNVVEFNMSNVEFVVI